MNEREAAIHELKTWPGPFNELLSGRKKHEFRKADRDFRIGDTLLLREFTLAYGYSGRELSAEITYIGTGFGIPDDYVCMSVSSLNQDDAGIAHAAKERDARIDARPKVVCFCGSTRFTSEMLILQWEYAKKGIIVHTWHALPFGYAADREAHVAEKEGVKEILDELHKRKIDLSDEVFVINLNGYIGDSTRSEIEYAESIGKPIRYLENPAKQALGGQG